MVFELGGVGADAAQLGTPVFHEITEFSWNTQQYRQEQDFFLLPVTDFQVDTAGMDAEEQATITAHRWWSADEIDASPEQIYPRTLAGLLRSLAGDN